MILKLEQVKSKIFKFPYVLYPYGNFRKYGLSNEVFNIYLSHKTYFSIYNKSLHIFSKFISNKVAKEISEFAKDKNIYDIRGSVNALKKINKFLHNSTINTGYAILVQNKKHAIKNLNILQATTNSEFKEIAKLVCGENKKRNPNYFSEEDYYKQIIERNDSGYTRTFYIKPDNEIVGVISTYAETKEYGVLGGLVVKEEHRHKGYGSSLLYYLINLLNNENKKSWLFCFNQDLLKFYTSISQKKYKYGVIYLN